MRLVLLIFITCLICSCKSKSNFASEKRQPAEYLLTISQQDSISFVDSLKWLMYALNYNGAAIFADSSGRNKFKLNPVECDVRLEGYAYKNPDSSGYRFSFIKDEFSFLFLDDIVFTEGFDIYNKTKYPFTRHVRFDYENSVNSSDEFIKRANDEFSRYLKSYKGVISPWLKEEARRRKILQ